MAHKERILYLERKQDIAKVEPVTAVGLYCRSESVVVSIEHSTHEEWKEFISRFVELEGEELDEWTLPERCDVLNFILEHCEPKPEMFLELA